MWDDIVEGIILEATYGQRIEYMNEGYTVKLTIKMYGWGYASMFFTTQEQVDKLFTMWRKHHRSDASIGVTLNDMIHTTVYMKDNGTTNVPSCLAFTSPVWNCNWTDDEWVYNNNYKDKVKGEVL